MIILLNKEMGLSYEDIRIEIFIGDNMTQVYSICPECSHTRQKSGDKCLSTNTETGQFNCHHCGYNGCNKDGIPNIQRQPAATRPTKPDQAKMLCTDLPEHVVKHFEDRGIGMDVLKRNRIGFQKGEIAFPYFRAGELVNIKYRKPGKTFRQIAGAEKVFYGLDDIVVSDEIIITEGEYDKLACEVAGYPNTLSVPDGAPSPAAKSYESKFSYIGNCEEELKDANKIILAVDGDAPGRKLEAELSRRLGPARCWRVKWPDGCKDANDVLVKHSEFELAAIIEEAKPMPVEGVFSVEDISKDIDSMYEDGLKGGVITGWHSLSQYYTVSPGETTVVTGIPSHGKSAWQTALMVNIALSQGWRFAIFSPENHPLERHAAQIASLYIGKPFKHGPTNRMTMEELIKAKAWMHDHFTFILPPDDQLTIESILDKAKVAVTRYGIRGLVIDPWNECDHTRPAGQLETEYISETLTKIRRFARMYKLHVWIVAHPTKLLKGKDGKYPVPNPYDIAGSASFRSKADNCIAIWRELLDESKAVQIHIQKVRFREVGKIGMATLSYDIATGRYQDAPPGT